MKCKNFKTGDKKKVISMIQNGYSVRCIANTLNLSRFVINNFLKEKNMTKNNKEKKFVTNIKLFYYYLFSKKSVQHISKIFNVPRSTLRRYCKKQEYILILIIAEMLILHVIKFYYM